MYTQRSRSAVLDEIPKSGVSVIFLNIFLHEELSSQDKISATIKPVDMFQLQLRKNGSTPE
jgi:hypothetical protein